MSLRTVRVPEAFTPAFELAERVVSEYFATLQRDPERGTLEIYGERYVLVRAASLSVDFFELVRGLFGGGRAEEAFEFGSNILFDLAHAIGKNDAANFHERMNVADPIARLSAGPVHFAHAGWAFVDIFPESRPSPDEDFYLIYDHPYSFEADAWLRGGKPSDSPVCIMNAGYSSGWCEASFDLTLVAVEIACRARGDGACRFVMAPPSRIEGHVERYFAERVAAGGQRARYAVPDFFARKRAEEALASAKNELEQRVSERTVELAESNSALRREMDERQAMERRLVQAEKLEALGTFAAGIAHDFNNLLGIIMGSVSLIARDDAATAGYVGEALEACERAAALTRQLLAFGSARAPQGATLVDVGVEVARLLALLRRVIGEDVELIVDVPPDLGRVRVDPAQLDRSLVNLVVNARDAMPQGGRLKVRARREVVAAARRVASGELQPGAYCRLDVVDSGVGMDDATLARIFDPFFTTKGVGAGLGLSTVYGIVQRTGGAVDVESAPGRGTAFTLFLPSAPPPSAAPPAPPELPTAAGSGELILLVEDEAQLCAVASRALERHGYRVVAHQYPERAAQISDDELAQVDLLVSDVVMPQLSGPDLAARLRQRRADLPVLFVSGYHDGTGLANGTDPLLPKPFTPRALIERVQRLLAHRARAPGR